MIKPGSMLRPDAADRGELVTDMAIELIADGGVEAVTLRSLAQRIRATPSGVLRWFDSSAHMWGRIVAAFGRRWEHWLADRARPDPRREPFEDVRVNAMLPFTDEEARWTRVWLALVEAGRSRPDLAPRIAPVEARERVVLARPTSRCRWRTPTSCSMGTRPATHSTLSEWWRHSSAWARWREALSRGASAARRPPGRAVR
jgi:AcrR family transcriptional regulator